MFEASFALILMDGYQLRATVSKPAESGRRILGAAAMTVGGAKRRTYGLSQPW
jgi:hypothetical protein